MVQDLGNMVNFLIKIVLLIYNLHYLVTSFHGLEIRILVLFYLYINYLNYGRKLAQIKLYNIVMD